MKRIRLLLLLSLIACTPLFSQEELPEVFDNEIYVPYIKSVKFHIAGFPLTIPMVDINSSAQLLLYFDDLDDEPKDFFYSIVHCDSDWTRSDLAEMEYLDGFNEEEIFDFELSYNTRIPYTQYYLPIPNSSTQWTKSGNYALVVYVDDGDGYRKIAFIRRFMVVEPLFKITVQPSRPADVRKYRTHQELDFIVNHKKITIRNPRLEIEACVLQNGRWDNAITGLRPRYIRSNNLLTFDFQDEVVFPAVKEFRNFDIRTLLFRSERVAQLKRFKDHWEVQLVPDQSRMNGAYYFNPDINGNFITASLDSLQDLNSLDYADVFFQLDVDAPLFDKDIYVFGGLSDWQLKEEYRLEYDESCSCYRGTAPFKQGFYDYLYAFRDIDTPEKVDYQSLEGNTFQTRNEYTFLVYYRPFGARYDRLMGANTITFP